VRNGTSADLVIGQFDMNRVFINTPSNDPNVRGRSSLLLPVDVEVDPAGNVWVSDFGNGRVLRFPKPFDNRPPPGAAAEADLVLGQFDFTSYNNDATALTMRGPWGLRFSSQGSLFVADTPHNRVLQFDPPFQNGKAASRVFGQPDFVSKAAGNAANRFNSPTGISFDTSDRLYVCDSSNNRLMIFGDVRLSGGDPSAVATIGGLRSPLSVHVSVRTGEVWVADTNNNRVLRLKPFDRLSIGDTTPIQTIPVAGPLGVEEDAFGNLFAADSFNRVAVHFPLLALTNGANYLTRVTPGMITSLWFPPNDSIEPKSFDQLPNPLPLPKELSDVQVLVNGQPQGLYFVATNQVNFQMSNSAPTSGTAEVVLLRPSTLQILAASQVAMDVASPGLFTRPPTGSGQIAALNQDNSVNSSERPAKPGEIVALFGTGPGHIPGAPPDGEPAPPDRLIWTPAKPRVFLYSRYLDDADITFSGLAPGLVGVWQINIKIGDFVPDGNAVPVVVFMYDIPSGSATGSVRTTIAVKR
jgi:uncharacterized protein (TIGR03437 family)